MEDEKWVSVIHPELWAQIRTGVERYNRSLGWRIWYWGTAILFWRPYYWLAGYRDD